MRIEQLCSADWQRLRTVRLAALADAPDAFGSTLAEAERYQPSDWRRQLSSLATYVAVNADGDVGMARGVTASTNTSDALLISMWVAPLARGQGAGEGLIQAVIDWAVEAGHSRLLLDVADENRPAIRLYERMGFTPTGETGSLPPPRQHVLEHRRARVLGAVPNPD